MEKVYLGKGRSEYVGSISGDIYIIEDNGKVYYYLINILNPEDIYIVTKSDKIRKEKEVSPASSLLAFHRHCLHLKNQKTEDVKQAISKEKTAKEMAILRERIVHDVETTKFVVSQIGTEYKTVNLKYCGSHLVVYEIDDTWELRIEGNNKKSRKYIMINIATAKAEYTRKLSLFMSSTGLPKNICKCFTKKFTDEEALKVLAQISKDHEAFLTDPSYLSNIATSYQYMDYLANQTGCTKVTSLTYDQKNSIVYFVF